MFNKINYNEMEMVKTKKDLQYKLRIKIYLKSPSSTGYDILYIR